MQFHPELNWDSLQERLEMYPHYSANKLEYDVSTPIKAPLILKRFVGLAGVNWQVRGLADIERW